MAVMNRLAKFSPFLGDVQAKGVKRATAEKLNEIVSRITVGMDIAEIRAIVRGEPPLTRPNPRLKPHADGFLFHIRPSYYHKDVAGLYPTFRLGWFSFFFFVVETITGLFLMIYYTPSPTSAYENMLRILNNVALGQFFRDLHRLGAELMVITVALHMLRTFLTGSYKKPRQFTWFTGVLLLLITLFLSFSGYLLPWDQLSLWAVTIGTSMAEKAPTPFPLNLLGQALFGQGDFIGPNINLILRGSPDIGAGGLLRFYLLHVFALPLLAFLFIGVHYYKVVLYGHSLPPEKEPVGEDTAKRVPMDKRVYYTPDVLTHDVFLTITASALMILAVATFFHAPLEHHADPLVTPLHTTAPWYFLWLQGLLKVGDPVFWGLVIPTLLFGLLFVLPYIEVGPSRRYVDRKVGLSAGLMLGAAIIVLTFMGTPLYKVQTSPDQEVGQDMIPQEGIGPIREIPYDQLAIGAYSTSPAADTSALCPPYDPVAAAWLPQQPVPINPLPANAPALQQAMEDLHGLVQPSGKYAAGNWPHGLVNGVGTVIISQKQNNLKQVILCVADQGPNPAIKPFAKVTYISAQSDYEEE